MFASSMKEAREGVVRIDDVSPSTVKELLRFVYFGEIENHDACLKELFVAADKYGMEDLRGLCEKYLLDRLCVETVLETYDLCQTHGSPLLLKKAKEIIIWYT
jgi:speckle-type POZ protein